MKKLLVCALMAASLFVSCAETGGRGKQDVKKDEAQAARGAAEVKEQPAEVERVTPQEKDRLFAEKMAREGKTLRPDIGKDAWLTDDEYCAKKGYVRHEGRWVTKEQHKGIMEDAAQKRRVAEAKRGELARRAEELRKKRLAALEKAEARKKAKYAPDGKEWVLDGFSGSGRTKWRPQAWGNPCEVSVVKYQGSERLCIKIEAGAKDKAAVAYSLRGLDLTSRDAIRIDVINAGERPITMAMAIVTSEFFESRMVSIKPGLNEGVKFMLQSSAFKAASTGWTHKAQPAKLEKSRFIYLLFYTKRAATLYLGNMVATK